MIFALERVGIADRGTAVDAAGRVERAAVVQQCFNERCLAAPRVSDQGDGTYGTGAVTHGRPRPVVDVGPLLAKTEPCAIRGNRPIRRRSRAVTGAAISPPDRKWLIVSSTSNREKVA